MKKNAIIIFIIVIIALTYNSITKEEVTQKNELQDKNTIEYRIEEQQNLISNTEQIIYNTNDNVEFTNYIETINSDITTITNKQELSPIDKETLKNTFITLTDFIFYNGEIKGTTFSELTQTAKEKVISIYEKIDAKIESVYPGYKEMIKDTSIKTYSNIKEKLDPFVCAVTQGQKSTYKGNTDRDRCFEHQLSFINALSVSVLNHNGVSDGIPRDGNQINCTSKSRVKLDNIRQENKVISIKHIVQN